MTCTLYVLVFVVFNVVTVQIGGQDICIPQPVQDVVLHDDFVLSWNPAPNETCEVTQYLVSLAHESNWYPRYFLVNETAMDVDFLPQCEGLRIFVTPVSSENVEGPYTYQFTTTSAPPDVNIDLAYFRLSQFMPGIINLIWDVSDEWRPCVREYRVVAYNEDADNVFVTDYISYAFAYVDTVPCTSYVFTVTALHSLAEEGQTAVIRYTSPSEKISAPSLQALTAGSTTIDFTWTFAGPSANRCPVTALVVDASPYFNVSYPVSSQNQISRPPMTIRLSGLQPDTMYLLSVSANNTAGLSEPVIIVVQTLEQ